jgi:hypothetical protein
MQGQLKVGLNGRRQRLLYSRREFDSTENTTLNLYLNTCEGAEAMNKFESELKA